MLRYGKKAAGRVLDGVVHDAYPTPRVVGTPELDGRTWTETPGGPS